MAQKRLSVRKIREILRLRHEQGLSHREVARSLSMGATSVGDCLSRFRAMNLTWQEALIFSDEDLETSLYPKKNIRQEAADCPNWPDLHRELRRKGMTLQLLWEEYKEQSPGGYQYSQFCFRYKKFVRSVEYVFRNDHRGGEKLFIDYAGMTVPIQDRATGDLHKAQIFIATFGASNYTYAEATWSQKIPDWIGSHQRAFIFFGGVPEVLVPDNLKSAVTKACRYDPDINPAYHEMARHFGCAVVPARARKPRDKAKVENAVLVVERWILAVLRKRQFFSLDELNQEVKILLTRLNSRPFKKMSGNRAEHFAQLDRPHLKPLPEKLFEMAEFKLAKVNINYHVEVESHSYSVPHTLVQERVEIRYTATVIEIFHQGVRAASHPRSYRKWGYTTVEEHMPLSHREHVSWTPERLSRWAAKSGVQTQKVTDSIMAAKTYPQQGYRAVLGLMRMGQTFGQDRLEAACARAIQIGSPTYKSVGSILKRCLDQTQMPLGEEFLSDKLPPHSNIRGREYFLN
jgi:transposase